MELPQSHERIRGRDAMRARQEASPTPPGVRLRRVSGSGRTWVIEGINDYDGDVWNFVLIVELDEQGLIVRETRYYGQPFDPRAGDLAGSSRSSERRTVTALSDNPERNP